MPKSASRTKRERDRRNKQKKNNWHKPETTKANRKRIEKKIPAWKRHIKILTRGWKRKNALYGLPLTLLLLLLAFLCNSNNNIIINAMVPYNRKKGIQTCFNAAFFFFFLVCERFVVVACLLFACSLFYIFFSIQNIT